ncbi:MAG: patatin-like phospholipase family protein [Massilibacteroides sp.]|nr:patatin-like phospholipase family protein [Massilibacteroides sp.]
MKKKAKTYPYKLGLALGGGGVRGFAHLGVLDALQERGLKPDILSGSSAGALAGVFYADGYSTKEIIAFFKGIKFGELATTSLPRSGFFKMDGLAKFLEKHLKARTFEELKTPLRVMVSDIENGESILLDTGELIPAVLASCAFPIVFQPIKIGERYYVDGGLFRNLPASALRKDCEKVIGVNISPLCPMKYSASLKYIIERSLHYLMVENAMTDRKICDYLIESTEIGNYPIFDLRKGKDIYKKGYEVAHAYFEENKKRLQQDFFIPPTEGKNISFFQKIFSSKE